MSKNMSPKQFRQYMEDQRRELLNYRWGLGEKNRHDPCLDRSENEIYCEWIQKYSQSFRESWEQEHELYD